MRLVFFVGGVLIGVAGGGIGLLLDASSEKGIRYLQNDLIAIALVSVFVGLVCAFLAWAFLDRRPV